MLFFFDSPYQSVGVKDWPQTSVTKLGVVAVARSLGLKKRSYLYECVHCKLSDKVKATGNKQIICYV